MMHTQISRAVLLAFNTAPPGASYDAVYGGETLCNRALIAMSKAGIRAVKLLCPEGRRKRLEALVSAVRPRLVLDYELVELRRGETLAEKIVHLAATWDEPFLLFAADKIVHPTFFKQAMQFSAAPQPLLLAHKQVWVQDERVQFAGGFPDKFKVIFANTRVLTKIAVPKTVCQQTTVCLIAANPVDISPEVKTGVISTEVVVCRRADVQTLQFNDVAELVQCWNENKSLAVGFVENAWWLKVTGTESQAQIKEFFWSIAFKEISGEFSKLVNSKLSKPLTFLFVRLGFSPNAISILELALFFVSSAFLLLDRYWAMMTFAVVWQLAAGVLDRCDGEVARVRNYESESGARFDMLIDDLRFGLPFLFLTIACYRESHHDAFYLLIAATTFFWYATTVVCHNRFLRRAGYVSIQAMGVDFLRTQEGTGWLKVFRKIQPFTKGDIRTFYLTVLAFLGRKPVLFWLLVAYAWPLGASYLFTIKKFRPPSSVVQASG